MAIDMDRFWGDEAGKPGVTDEQITAWEARRGVRLPAVLRDAMMRQNGGLVRYSDVRVVPLEEIAPPDDEFFLWVACDEVAANREWLIAFAFGDDEPMYLLNFNANGPQGEPRVHHVYHDAGDMNDEAETVDAFFSQLLDVTATPAVDWAETARLDVVLFQETVAYNQRIRIDQVLGRQNGALVLFTHDQDGAIYTKTTIPEPISTSIDGIWPILRSLHMLQLGPMDPSGIVAIESTRTGDGNWKNRTDHGAPVYVSIESTDKATLQALRETLIGTAAVRAEDRNKWWLTWIVVPLVLTGSLPVVLLVLLVLWTLRLTYWMFGFRAPPPASKA